METVRINVFIFPILLDNLDIKNAPNAPKTCIKRIAVINPLVPSPCGQLISLLALSTMLFLKFENVIVN